MADLSPNMAIIALKASSPNITIKRKRLAEQIYILTWPTSAL